MTEVLDRTPAPPPAATDLAGEVQRVLAASPEPLTLPKIRARLPAAYRGTDPKELADVLQRQVAANVLYQYPRYRSPHDRFWDRGLAVHVACLIRSALEEKPLPWSELRRKLPAYAHGQAQAVLDEQLAQGMLHRHPRAVSRGAERFGVRPPDPKDFLRQELPVLFTRLAGLGFTTPQLRQAALELLHEEEWDLTAPPREEARRPAAGDDETPGEGPEPSEPAASTTEPAGATAPEPPRAPETAAAPGPAPAALGGPHQPARLQGATHPDAPDVSQAP
jgi:hypothetical protein